MENATKALLIAAAILIAIVLISVGVFVLNMGRESVNSVNMNEQEIMAFNSKFTSYEGTQRGSQINALLQTVLTNNRAAGDEGSEKTKGIDVYDNTTQIISGANKGAETSIKRYNTGTMYTVSIDYTSGLVHRITIKEKTT